MIGVTAFLTAVVTLVTAVETFGAVVDGAVLLLMYAASVAETIGLASTEPPALMTGAAGAA